MKDSKRLAMIISYFEDGRTKVVDDLIKLFDTENEKKVTNDFNIQTGYVDALVVLACHVLPDGYENIKKYTDYTKIDTPTGTLRDGYARVWPHDGGGTSPGDTKWRDELKNTNTTIDRKTPLAEVLTHILNVARSRVPKDDKFIQFLTDVQSGKFLSNQLKGGQAMDKYSAMDRIKEAIKNSASGKKCVVFTGAPGTGKTYCVEECVKGTMKMYGFDKKEYFVQFHSSYDYTDFVEGLRPIQVDGENGKKEMIFVRMDGIFKAFCRKVVEWNKKYDLDKKPAGNNPSTGSRDGADEEVSPKSEEEPLRCETSDGKKLPYYYFVIDEINRADLGRVFGELMYCFEKRGEEHKIATQYTNLTAYGKDKDGELGFLEGDADYFKNGFYIPENVIIIGTMNDIDRSVETFDFALRRRFDWIEIEADAVMKHSLEEMHVQTDIIDQITKMNKIVKDQPGLGPEFKIGPAYFKDYNGNNLNNIWNRNIEPILREYVRGRQNIDKFIQACGTALGVLEDKAGLQGGGAASGTQQAQTQPTGTQQP